MRKFNFALVISLFSILIFSSCAKEQDSSLDTTNPSSQLISNHSDIYYSKLLVGDVDFNEFGNFHNKYLDYVRSHSEFMTLNNQQRYEYGKSFFESSSKSYSNNETWSTFSPKLSMITNIVDSLLLIQDMYQYLVSNNISTPYLAKFYDGLSSVYINSLDNEVLISPETFSKSVFQLLNSLDLKDAYLDTKKEVCNEAAAIYTVASIAVYSYDYWYHNYDNWKDKDENVGLKDLWNRIKRGAADAFGFAIKPWYKDNKGTYWWSYPEALYYADECSNAVDY